MDWQGANFGVLSPSEQAEVDPRENELRNKFLYGLLTAPNNMAKDAIQAAGNYQPGDPSTYNAKPVFDAALATLAPGTLMPAERNAVGMGIKAYHGSPHDFDKFDLSKIGTGEGAQAYGHGLYFAEKEGVARGYRDALAPGQNLTFNGRPVSSLPTSDAAAVTWMHNTGLTPQQVAAQADAHAAQELAKAKAAGDFDIAKEMGVSPEDLFGTNKRNIANAARRIAESGKYEIGYGPEGRMYEVNINAHPDQFLDWDKPLAGQAPVIQEAFGKIIPPPGTSRYLDDTLLAAPTKNGAEYKADAGRLYQQIGRGDQSAFSQKLNEAGIPGIKYLDQGSRAAGDGSRNYVVFNDKLIDILKKYGILAPGGLGAAAATQSSDSQN